MCGIVGVLNLDGSAPGPALLSRMTATLRHRGPDGEGIWCEGPAGFGMRRLAIIDLSERANQPMSNEDGSLWLVFNGEIYNFQSLRAELAAKGHVFRSDGDAEAVLHLYEEKGIECLRWLRGMFAFGLWDARDRTLFLARDRLGKKPLFYYRDDHVFLFASEPKAMLQHPRLQAEADPEPIHHFLTYGYVPGPWSAFRGVRKLLPGHYLTVRRGEVTTHRYWSLRYTPKRTEADAALAEELEARLEEAVRLRLVSDVPLGALLSGGLDSSAVVGVARRFTSGPFRTFSVGFEEPEYDETAYAREVAQRFETEHHELVVKPDAVSLLPRLVWHYNEPFADSSAVPSLLLCEMARQFVTVALSGDGGDEAFLGYDRYRAARLAAWLDRVPAGLRRGIATVGRRMATTSPRSARERVRRFVEALPLEPGPRYGSWISVMDERQKQELYTDEFAARVESLDAFAPLRGALARTDAEEVAEAANHADIAMYLPDDLLVKMDIASMAHSLEVRSPFLDHELLEFAARLPSSLKLRGFTSKYLMKKMMKRDLPEAVLGRRKMGFGIPIDRWFRRELQEVAWDLLLDSRARSRGYFRPHVVRRWLAEHAEGRAQHHTRLWSLLLLELWHRMFIDRPCPAAPPALAG